MNKKKLEQQKKQAAEKALDYVERNMIIGVGTGSTIHYFIEALAATKKRIKGAIASSLSTEKKLKEHQIPVIAFNEVQTLPIYIDGADRFNDFKYLIKGGGGALCREKIIAQASDQFICVVDKSKYSPSLSGFPLAIEVIPMARSFVARTLIKKVGGDPIYRENFITDNGNIILDIFNVDIKTPIQLEELLNQIPGVVAHGLFAKRSADVMIIGED